MVVGLSKLKERKKKKKKPTYEERKLIANEGLDTYVWLVQKNCPEFMQIVNKETGEVKKIVK